MKRIALTIIISLLISINMVMADDYTGMWKDISKARENDLPASQIELLDKLIARAEKDGSYGNLIKATKERIEARYNISPDSLKTDLIRLENNIGKVKDNGILYALYNSLLGSFYKERASEYYHDQTKRLELIDKADKFFKASLSNPEITAGIKTKDLYPFFSEKNDCDLLVSLAYNAAMFEEARDYYLKTGNRPAAVLMSLETVRNNRTERKSYISSLDSLINQYGDINECCEVAIAKYDCLNEAQDVSAKDKIRFVRESLKRWGSWQRSSVLKNAELILTRPSFKVVINKTQISENEEFELSLKNVRNISRITARVWRTDLTTADVIRHNNSGKSDEDFYKSIIKSLNKKNCMNFNVMFSAPDYEYSDKTLNIENLEKGIYIIETACNVKGIRPVYNLLYVSNLYVMSQSLPGNKTRIAVVDIASGQPVKNASIKLYSWNGNRKSNEQEEVTDSNGEIILSDTRKAHIVYAFTDNDRYMCSTRVSHSFGFRDYTRDNSRTVILTDRAVYRPGQTVKVAVVTYRNIHEKDLKVEGGKNVEITLKDANYKVIAQKNITTDEYGSGSAEFILPARTLNGRFHISADNSGYTTVRVEEYKRPTFEVVFTEPKEEYQLGDTLNVKAVVNSFAGVPVQGASVRYKIKRAWYPWLRYYAANSNDVISEGRTTTSPEGSFNVNVPLTILNDRNTGCYYFTIEADVTDAAGETRNGRLSLPVSNRKVWLECNLPEKIEKGNLKSVRFSLKNIAGTEIESAVTFSIDGAEQHTVKANEEISFESIINNISSGRHKLTASAMGEKFEKDFVIFSLSDKTPAADTDEWFYLTSETFPENGECVSMQIGSSNNVHVLYSVVSGKKIIKIGTIDINNEIKTYNLKYKEEYGDGIVINYAWVKDGKLVTRNVSVKKSLPKKQLDIKWITFRNRLTPGEKEQWTLQVSNTDGSKADASLTATLYDMSLDNIVPHAWNKIYGLAINVPFINWNGTGNNDNQCEYVQAELKWFDNKESLFEKFPHIDLYSNVNTMEYDALMMPKTRLAGRSAQYSGNGFDVMEKSAEASSQEEYVTENNVSKVPLLRENLSETAFFYPSLTTDDNGNVNISFTLPESLTTWKFMAFAHDKEMQNGVLTDKVIAQKKVMVQPSMPRFVRKGDEVTISARIFNLSDNVISGNAVMQICSAETEDIITERRAEFKIEKDGTASVSFRYKADTKDDILICRIFANGKDFSDGEQHFLNVLSDREMVTNTHAVTMNKAGNFKINADDLFSKNASDCRITLEYTENPSWFVIQALPTVAESSKDDAISAATQIYANVIARHTASSNKYIKRVIDVWNASAAKKSLVSNLNKNNELKELVIEETPWIMEAADETMQKQRLAEMFDENVMSYRINSATEKLRAAQHNDGSWGWWPGMQGNRYITTTVAEILVRLEVITGTDSSLKSITDRAMEYLSKAAAERVKDLKKDKNYRVTQSDLHYLYLKTLRNDRLNDADRWLLEKLTDTEVSELSIYDKCMSAIISARSGNEEKAQQLIRSVKEYSVYTEDMGRYFDSHKAGYSWCDYKIPTEVMAIEAVNTVTPNDAETISEMQQWLLQEKQTTAWSTPINSVNAIYAFSNIGKAKYSAEVNDVVTINGREIKNAEAGTGYLKTSEGGRRFDVSVNKKDNETSWLSLYGTYTTDVRDVADKSSGIKIKREIISENKDIKTGDRIKVRITVTASRDYDFVQVTDRRAACMEPVNQISGYNGRYYCSMKDNAAYYYFDILPKGTHVIETEYYVDRSGTYTTGTCKVQCSYAPEFSGITKSTTITVK